LDGSWLTRPGISQWSFRVPFGVEPAGRDVDEDVRAWYLRSRELAGVAPIAFAGEHPRDALMRLATEPLRAVWASRWEPDPEQLAAVRWDLLEATRRSLFGGPDGARDLGGLTYNVAPMHLIDPRMLDGDPRGLLTERVSYEELHAAQFTELVVLGARVGFEVSVDAVTAMNDALRRAT
jgi:hypothetical protein